MGGGGKEGDWECSGCHNINYAFRTLCNNCKLPRFLVNARTPSDSKWLPRIGDWVCSGCTNNNYASREKCNKCGQPKEVAAMPAIAMTRVSPSMQGGLVPRMGLLGGSTFQESVPASSNWSSFGANNVDQQSFVPSGWRSGDWICNCGFHNYSSRTQCKNCNAGPPVRGTKRLATDEPVHFWENNRQNAGVEPAINHYTQSYSAFGPGLIGDQRTALYSSYPNGAAAVSPSLPGPIQLPQGPSLIGKGAKQWRDGDWMCSNCNNHNYASRSECNRCKTQKHVIAEPVGAA